VCIPNASIIGVASWAVFLDNASGADGKVGVSGGVAGLVACSALLLLATSLVVGYKLTLRYFFSHSLTGFSFLLNSTCCVHTTSARRVIREAVNKTSTNKQYNIRQK